MPIRDVAGELRTGVFEKVPLPNGEVAVPVNGTANHIDYRIGGKIVRSTARYAPHMVEYSAMIENDLQR